MKFHLKNFLLKESLPSCMFLDTPELKVTALQSYPILFSFFFKEMKEFSN